MCSPTLVAAVSAVSTVMQGYAAKQQGEYSNKVAQYNARNQENEAIQTRNKAVEAENIQRQRTAQLISKQRAQLGAANVDLSTGSAAGLIEDTATLGEADALRIKSNYSLQATSMDQQAGLTRADGAAKQAAGSAAFTSSILSAGAGFADKWFKPDSVATQAAAPVREGVWTPVIR